MDYKLSVIIPCYNAEETIQRAINSIINQTLDFEDIELLLYDDASLDNTKKIIKKYSETNENIVAIFGDENKGPGFGKNKCLEKSSGEYVLFLDADDEFDQDMCYKLYSTAKLDNADLVSCGVLRYGNTKISKVILEYDDTKPIEDNEEKAIFINKNIFYLYDSLSTHCLFKREIIKKNKVYFLNTYYAEDIYFKSIYRLYSKKAVYLKNYFGYIHHAYTNSITSNIDLIKLHSIHNVYLKILKKMENCDLDLARIFKGYIECTLIRLYSLNLESSKNEIIDFLKIIREFEISVKFNYSLNHVIINILNKLIIKERYNLAYIYLSFLRATYNSKMTKNTYRLFLKIIKKIN